MPFSRRHMTLPIPRNRLTRRAIRALRLAQEEALRYGHDYVGTEHILLGLLGDEENLAVGALNALGVSPPQVRQAIGVLMGRGDRTERGDVELTPRAATSLLLAQEEARRLGHDYIGTEHQLLGLIREGDGMAAGVLQSLGVTLESAYGAVTAILEQTATDAPVTKDNVITCRISNPDLSAIDALVEAGIRSTRSDAAAWLIHAGIEANRPLLDTVYGTVEEIRRLREVARSLAREVAPEETGAAPA